MAKKEIPSELAEWIQAQAAQMIQTARQIQAAAKPEEGQEAAEWLIPLLEDFSRVEKISKRGAHLLAAYSLRNGVTTQTDLARAMGLTVTAAANRSASKIARETWAEVWPDNP